MSQGELSITDITGKVIHRNIYTLCKDECQHFIDLSKAQTGIYLVQLSNENGSMVKRISIVG